MTTGAIMIQGHFVNTSQPLATVMKCASAGINAISILGMDGAKLRVVIAKSLKMWNLNKSFPDDVLLPQNSTTV